MVTFKIRDGYLEMVSGEVKFIPSAGAKLPQTFRIEGVDLSQATLTPEAALAVQLPALKGMRQDTLRWAWKNYTYEAARQVLASAGIKVK